MLYEYKGIRKSYRLTQDDALTQRPDIESLPLQEAIVELLLRISLDQKSDLKVPTKIKAQVEELVRILMKVRPPEATVEDAAEATIRLYDYIRQLMNREVPEDEWEDFNTDEMEQQEQNVDMSMPAAYGAGGAEGEESATGESGEGEGEEEQPYDAAQDVGYRGEFKPELVQLLAKLRQGQDGEETQASGDPISPEALKELLEKSVEIEIDQASEGEITNSASMFVDNLMGQIGQDQQEPGKGQNVDTSPPAGGPLQADDAKTFLYDEWDFRANDYKPNWCSVKERVMEEGTVEFYEKDAPGILPPAVPDQAPVRAPGPGDVPQGPPPTRRRRHRLRRRCRSNDRKGHGQLSFRQNLLAPQQDPARCFRRLPAGHERLDRRGH